jgi:hypothetical protein
MEKTILKHFPPLRTTVRSMRARWLVFAVLLLLGAGVATANDGPQLVAEGAEVWSALHVGDGDLHMAPARLLCHRAGWTDTASGSATLYYNSGKKDPQPQGKVLRPEWLQWESSRAIRGPSSMLFVAKFDFIHNRWC